MSSTSRNRRLALGFLALTLLVATAWAVPSLSQSPTRGYARLLCPKAAAAPDAVTDCRMAAARLRGPCGQDAPIPDDAFDTLLAQCRRAAGTPTAEARTARM